MNLRYSMKEDGPYTIEELPAYTDAGKYTIYFEASSDSAKSCYGQASLEITKAVTELKLLATPAGSEGAGSVTLKVLNRESAQMNRWILLAMIPALHWLRRK